jgi:hypothetical protein
LSLKYLAGLADRDALDLEERALLPLLPDLELRIDLPLLLLL